MLPYYPLINDPWFQYKICRKLELMNLSMHEDRYAFQMLIRLLYGPHSPYGEVCIFWAPGTGKTRAIIHLIYSYFDDIRKVGVYKDEEGTHLIGNSMKPIFMAENDNTITNFKDQMKDCMPGLFKSKRYTDISSSRRQNTKGVKQYVELLKYDTFSKTLSEMTDSEIIDTYNGRVVICDEAHYIRVREKKNGGDNKNTYAQIRRFLTLIRGKKVLITATPAFGDISHFTSIFNLILPQDCPPIETSKILSLNGDELIEYLAPYLVGRVSYMKQFQMPTRISDKGVRIAYRINHNGSYLRAEMSDEQGRVSSTPRSHETSIPIIRMPMSRFQQRIYMRTLKKHVSNDTNPAQRSLELDLRCISNFVFPDGKYGKVSFSSNREAIVSMEDDIDETIQIWVTYNKTMKRYEFTKKMIEALDEHGIQRFSTKYYKICKSIIKDYKRGRPGFTFSFFYEPGVVIIGLCLEWLSYRYYNAWLEGGKVSDEEYLRRPLLKAPFVLYNGKLTADQIIAEGPKPRFAVVPQTQANALVSNIRELYNHILNREGAYLIDIIGSEKISTSTNLSNGVVYRCTGGVWTPGEYDQSSNRVMRSDSQIWKPLEERKVYTRNYASVLTSSDDPAYPEFAVEEKMYIKCDEKFKAIYKLMDVIDMVNVCGPLFKHRNAIEDDDIFYGYNRTLKRVDGRLKWTKRDFDHPTDTSSYHLFLSQKKLTGDSISFLLTERSNMIMDQVYDLIRPSQSNASHQRTYNTEAVLFTVQDLIRADTIVCDSYGAMKYMRNDGDTLYLSDGARNACKEDIKLDVHYSESLYIRKSIPVYDDDVLERSNAIMDMIREVFDPTSNQHDDKSSENMYHSIKNCIINSKADVQSYLLERSLIPDTSDEVDDVISSVIRDMLKYRYYVFKSHSDVVTILHTAYHMTKTKGTANRNMKQMVSKNLLRIYSERDVVARWRYCTSGEDSIYIGKINEYISESIDRCIAKSFKSYGLKVSGIVNTADFIFKIHDRAIQSERKKKGSDETDKRTLCSGSQFSKWKPSHLLEYLYRFEAPAPDLQDAPIPNRAKMIAVIRKGRIKDIPSDIDMIVYFYRFSMAKMTSRQQLCTLLEDRLTELDLIVYI